MTYYFPKLICKKLIFFLWTYSLINIFSFFFCPMPYTLKEGGWPLLPSSKQQAKVTQLQALQGEVEAGY